ncbi:hypothetical protein ACWT_0864 [Actinoplanes sp. SE50]|uniref:hypothetical protein n=1 Tax=unclassified Actinoplanes TaxID=2626549 RepID=UPI00023EC1FE|nr:MULTISPECIES: hypothetical protein [unclassified Actinoplanes]AEV81878.1 hypothetical protein ACPL_981 [Actinoplanes sp. SE50/110]ATO80279.1 hypothetical protein ACWT_0864 [Actinoplanes sp. SE50]SLL97684.1 hypothetical protein ACSP50_0893 [Actinoplanes sp. SE50/110]
MAGEVTGGDLFHLWRVSEVHLPRIADVFYDANRLLGGSTGGGDSFRVNGPAYPGSSVMISGIGAAWEDLRSEMQLMMEQVGTTVLDAAQGVRNATQAYIDVDNENANLLRDYLNDPDNVDRADAASNPPVPGSDEDPGKPYPAA